MQVHHTNIYRISEYSVHLKALNQEDKISRFGYPASDHSIDQLILNMCYHPRDHELWYVEVDDVRVGWGHLAKNDDSSWELAVSVDSTHQRLGIGNRLITEMLDWAKFHNITHLYMQCIENNRVIQHLADKNGLKTRSRGGGERTASIEVPNPTIFEANNQLFKEQKEIFDEFGKLRNRLTKLWSTPILPK